MMAKFTNRTLALTVAQSVRLILYIPCQKNHNTAIMSTSCRILFISLNWKDTVKSSFTFLKAITNLRKDIR